MKYEEWIQYEEKRLTQPDPRTWISLEPTLFLYPPSAKTDSLQEDKSSVWTMVVQVFNSHRI